MIFFKKNFLGCEPTIDLIEYCEFIGTPPPTAPSTTIPTHNCPSNEIAVGCDHCREAFCCDSGRVS